MLSTKFVQTKVYDIPVKTIENFDEVFKLSQLVHTGDNSTIYAVAGEPKIIKLTDIGFISTFRVGMLENINYATLSRRLPDHIIPRYYDGFMLNDRAGQRFALVLETVPGVGLDKIATFTAASYVHVAKWIFWALSHIHWKDMVYRNFDPRNILYDENSGQLHLLDLKNMFATAGPRAEFEDGVDFKKEDVRDAANLLLDLVDRVGGEVGQTVKILEAGLAEHQIDRPTASQMYELLVDKV